MDTLQYQRQRLEDEVIDANANIRMIRESEFPDLNALQQLMESIERNKQLIGMIDNHRQCDLQSVSKRR